jgi:uncharacterized protein (TIGR03083 family)
MREKEFYLQALKREAASFAEAVMLKPEPPTVTIPTCPAWNMTDLLLHLGTVHRFVKKTISVRSQRQLQFQDVASEFSRLSPQQKEWLAKGSAPASEPITTELVEWFKEGAAQLEAIFAETDLETAVWFWGLENKVAGWLRIQAIEAAIHRWDAQNALGVAQPIEAELAVDEIEFALELIPIRRQRKQAIACQGESYKFHRTDGPQEWLVRFDPDEITISSEAGEAEVTLSGTASDLVLFLWQRAEQSQFEVSGDAALVERYFQLVPPA